MVTAGSQSMMQSQRRVYNKDDVIDQGTDALDAYTSQFEKLNQKQYRVKDALPLLMNDSFFPLIGLNFDMASLSPRKLGKLA